MCTSTHTHALFWMECMKRCFYHLEKDIMRVKKHHILNKKQQPKPTAFLLNNRYKLLDSQIRDMPQADSTLISEIYLPFFQIIYGEMSIGWLFSCQSNYTE